MRMGAVGWTPGVDVFLPFSLLWQLFKVVSVTHCRRTFRPCHWVRAKALSWPQIGTPMLGHIV